MITKVVVFTLMILCFTGFIKAIVDIEAVNGGDMGTVFEENYLQSHAYMMETENAVGNLTRLLIEFKSEEHILNGGTLVEQELRNEEENLFAEFQYESRSYNPNRSEEENFQKFKEEYADKISQAKERLIKNDLKEYHAILQHLAENDEPLYYATDGVNTFSNSGNKTDQQFKAYPSYIVFENYKTETYPKEVKENERLHWVTERLNDLDPENDVVYLAFTEKYLTEKEKEWQVNKSKATKSFYQILGSLAGFALTFLYLVVTIGRRSFKDHELHLHPLDKLYNDMNLILCLGLTAFWIALLDDVFDNFHTMVVPVTVPIAAAGFVLILSLVKHVKNKTFFKHSLIFRIIYEIGNFIRNVYETGNTGIKTVLLVIGYPILIALTFFMFPVTIGLAAWFAYKKIKSFQVIKEGVEKIKDGDIHHTIDVGEKGEFASLAHDINSIADGLKKAVDSELKSERLKTELITNVSHDIRTPLTSIITYVDLLKNEKDPLKAEEYIEVLDQKSKRLKMLTDDLFEAAKASSGNIPVHFERIDIVSLITQGLGEVNEKIEELDLHVKIQHPNTKVYMKADGKLLWRSIENLLSNIFKYALKGSRVYIDIEEFDHEILVTFKNISAYELNISADELMERFTRGDESRSSQGSGLGLSIAQSLIEAQQGKLHIQIDGDLFKAMIYLPKHG